MQELIDYFKNEHGVICMAIGVQVCFQFCVCLRMQVYLSVCLHARAHVLGYMRSDLPRHW